MSEITVVLPSYNHAPFVERTLRSIFAQTVRPKKLIVIDDGSKDESVLIIERALQDYPADCELVARENRGLSKTLNQGLSLAESELFAYIGSDDVWFPTFLEKRVELLEKKPTAVLAFGDGFLIDENDQIVDSTTDWVDFAGGEALPHLLRGQVFPSASVVYRRAAVEKYGWNENSVLEDYELYLKLSADGEFAFDKTILCAWRQHSRNVSGDFPLMMREWLAAQNRVAARLKISREELDKIQSELKFDAVLSFIRHERRREALKLFRENLSGAKSFAQIGKTLFRLAIPPPLFRWNRNRKRQKTIEKYGKLKI